VYFLLCKTGSKFWKCASRRIYAIKESETIPKSRKASSSKRSQLGCSTCINEWYSGDGGLDKECPNCREPRGYAQTFQFKRINDFLNGFKNSCQTHLQRMGRRISHEKMTDTWHPIW